MDTEFSKKKKNSIIKNNLLGMMNVSLLMILSQSHISWSETQHQTPAPECKKSFQKVQIGIESYSESLSRVTQSILERELNSKQMEAIEKANLAGKGNPSEQIKILGNSEFLPKEIHSLMENGILWMGHSDPHDLLVKNLREGKITEETRYVLYGDSLEVSRINKISEETDDIFLVEMDHLDPSSGTVINGIFRVPKEIYDHNYSYKQAHPDWKVVFEAIQSTKESITSDDLILPPSTNEEAVLAEQGYESAYIRGIDDVNEWAAVRRQLQELKANPYTTHIEYFADQIESHIAHVRKGVEFLTGDAKRNALIELEKLETETRAVKGNRVTYKWWLEFNYQLAYAISEEPLPRRASGNSLFHGHDMEVVMTHFPLNMIVPTTKGLLGFMTLNRAQTEGIYPIGLTNKPKKDFTSPERFMEHDISHAIMQIRYSELHYSIGHNLFHKKILEVIKNLPTEKRKPSELIYFDLTHEVGKDAFFSDLWDLDPKNERKRTASRLREGITTGEYPHINASGKRQMRDITYRYADAFMEVYSQVRNYNSPR